MVFRVSYKPLYDLLRSPNFKSSVDLNMKKGFRNVWIFLLRLCTLDEIRTDYHRIKMSSRL